MRAWQGGADGAALGHERAGGSRRGGGSGRLGPGASGGWRSRGRGGWCRARCAAGGGAGGRRRRAAGQRRDRAVRAGCLFACIGGLTGYRKALSAGGKGAVQSGCPQAAALHGKVPRC